MNDGRSTQVKKGTRKEDATQTQNGVEMGAGFLTLIKMVFNFSLFFSFIKAMLSKLQVKGNKQTLERNEQTIGILLDFLKKLLLNYGGMLLNTKIQTLFIGLIGANRLTTWRYQETNEEAHRFVIIFLFLVSREFFFSELTGGGGGYHFRIENISIPNTKGRSNSSIWMTEWAAIWTNHMRMNAPPQNTDE